MKMNFFWIGVLSAVMVVGCSKKEPITCPYNTSFQTGETVQSVILQPATQAATYDFSTQSFYLVCSGSVPLYVNGIYMTPIPNSGGMAQGNYTTQSFLSSQASYIPTAQYTNSFNNTRGYCTGYSSIACNTFVYTLPVVTGLSATVDTSLCNLNFTTPAPAGTVFTMTATTANGPGPTGPLTIHCQ